MRAVAYHVEMSTKTGHPTHRSHATVRPVLRRDTVTVHPAADVQRIGQEDKTDPVFHSIWEDVQKLYATGLHPAIALHVEHKGRVVLDRTIGHLQNEPSGPTGAILTPDSLFNLFSASKIVTATLVHALVEDGVLDLNAPVVRWVPEFARYGKDAIQLRHLLNHTAGFPDMPLGINAEAALSSGRFPVETLYDLKPLTPPGQRSAYHPMTAWFVVQEIIERATGKDLRTLLQSRILDPLGFAHMNYGVSPDLIPQVAQHAITGPPTPPLMAQIFRRTVGVDLETAVRITNDPRFLTSILPSANVIGTPREVSRFLSLLLRGGALGGTRVLSEASVRRMVGEVTERQFDATFGFPMRYGLGVMMGGRRFSLFGLNTMGAFGHLGLSTVVIFADPARDLVVTFLNTGKPMMDPGMLRWYWVLQRIASAVPRR